MSATPYLFLDIDGVLHGSHMQYGYERVRVIEERIPRELVHPALQHDRRARPDYLSRRRPLPSTVRFRTSMRTSPALYADLAALDVDVRMLTTWLEHDSVEAFFAQVPGPAFPRRHNLRWPGRDPEDPLGAVPANWKLDELRRVLVEEPRPFIWADDDEVPIHRETVEREFGHLPHLLVAPRYSVGLTRFHVAQMREFVEAQRSGSAT